MSVVALCVEIDLYGAKVAGVLNAVAVDIGAERTVLWRTDSALRHHCAKARRQYRKVQNIDEVILRGIRSLQITGDQLIRTDQRCRRETRRPRQWDTTPQRVTFADGKIIRTSVDSGEDGSAVTRGIQRHWQDNGLRRAWRCAVRLVGRAPR